MLASCKAFGQGDVSMVMPGRTFLDLERPMCYEQPVSLTQMPSLQGLFVCPLWNDESFRRALPSSRSASKKSSARQPGFHQTTVHCGRCRPDRTRETELSRF